MAGGLVGEEFHLLVVIQSVLEKVDDVALIGDRERLALGHRLFGPLEGLGEIRCLPAYPALAVARLDARGVHLGDDRRRSRDLRGLRLRAAHAAKSGGDEEVSRKALALGKVEHLASGVEQRVICAVNYALRPDIHPAAGCHLPVVGDAERRRAAEILGVVKEADHQAVREDHARRGGMRTEKPERMSRLHDERLVLRHDLEILFDQLVLHPVLADLSRLAVGDEFVWIERHLKVKVVVDHHLEGPALDALALVLADRLSVELSLRTEAVAVDASVFLILLKELGGDLFMVLLGDIAERVLKGKYHLFFVKYLSAVRRSSYSRLELRLRRKPVRKFQSQFQCLS